MDPRPAPGGIEVWRVDLAPPAGLLEALRADLPADELARVERFVRERDRLRALAARAALRRLLAGRLGCAPRDVPIAAGPYGKPRLAAHAAPLRFNLAHSADRALIALARDLELGVDLEACEPSRADAPLAERVLAPGELALWRALPDSDRPRAFFRAWAAKEAAMKATGEGLGVDPRELDVLAADGEALSLRPRLRCAGVDLALAELDEGPAFAAALAWTDPRGHTPLVRTRAWTWR